MTFTLLVVIRVLEIVCRAKTAFRTGDGSDPYPDSYEALPQYKRRSEAKMV